MTAIVGFGLVVPTGPSVSAELAEGFDQEVVAGGGGSGLQSLTGFDFLPDGTVLVSEKRGRVKRIDPAAPANDRTILEIQDRVNTSGDRGMMSVAVDPEFATTRRIFVSYSYDDPDETVGVSGPDGAGGNGQRVSRVSSFELSANFQADLESEIVVLGKNSTWANIGDPAALQTDNTVDWACSNDANPQGPIEDCIASDSNSHQIGALRFGSDGALFVSHGDGANFSDEATDSRSLRALDPDHLVGKLLRVDKTTGKGLSDNPLYEGDGSSNRSRVWYSGFRNPFRFNLDTDDVPYVGDVGWNQFEEINSGEPGSSFGWPCYEGGLSQAEMDADRAQGAGTSREQQGYQLDFDAECEDFSVSSQDAPLWTWCHERVGVGTEHCRGGGLSAYFGVAIDGGNYPEEYDGLWFGDIVGGWLEVLDPNTGIIRPVADELGIVVDMRTGPDGDVYYVDRGTSTVSRLSYVGGSNRQPTAVAVAVDGKTSGPSPLTVTLDASGSSDPDGTIVSYDWDFDDGRSGTGVEVTHTFGGIRAYPVTLTVTDDEGSTASTTIVINSGNTEPVPIITSPADRTVDVGTLLQFEGSVNDAEDGVLPDDRLEWTTILHHNDHVHEDGVVGTGERPPPFRFIDHADDTYLEVCLSATDDGDPVGQNNPLTGTTCIDVFPNEVDYTFASEPSNLEILYAGQPLNTPATVRVPVGVTRPISAVESQDGFEFVRWSTGVAPVQDITIARTDRTVTAFYEDPLNPGEPIEPIEVDRIDDPAQSSGLEPAVRVAPPD